MQVGSMYASMLPMLHTQLHCQQQLEASGSAQSVAGIQGISSNVITFAEDGTYEFEFHTDDGGTTIYLSELTRPRTNFMNPINLASSDVVAAGAACSLATTTSYFTTVGGGNRHNTSCRCRRTN